MIRKLAERLSRSRVVKRRLSARFGRRVIHVSPDSALQFLRFNLELSNGELLNIAERHVSLGDSIWDVGANVGVFTFAAAHCVGANGQVLAVEPDPFLASLLQRTVQAASNADLRVAVLCAACSDEIGVSRFLIAKRGRSSNSLERSGQRTQAGGIRYVQHVPTLTLDSLLDSFPSPDFIKIDVEGAEEHVLRGAEKILSECRPSFYIEVGQEQTAAVSALFGRHSYRLFDGAVSEEAETKECSFNTLAIPEEQRYRKS